MYVYVFYWYSLICGLQVKLLLVLLYNFGLYVKDLRDVLIRTFRNPLDNVQWEYHVSRCQLLSWILPRSLVGSLILLAVNVIVMNTAAPADCAHRRKARRQGRMIPGKDLHRAMPEAARAWKRQLYRMPFDCIVIRSSIYSNLCMLYVCKPDLCSTNVYHAHGKVWDSSFLDVYKYGRWTKHGKMSSSEWNDSEGPVFGTRRPHTLIISCTSGYAHCIMTSPRRYCYVPYSFQSIVPLSV